MAADIIEHEGRVDCAADGVVRVRITSRSACGSCSARQACGLAEAQEKTVEVRTDRAAEFVPGDAVRVGVRRRAGSLAVLLGYVGALVVLMTVLVVAVEALDWSEGPAALASIAGVALYYGALWLFRSKIEHTIQFTINKI